MSEKKPEEKDMSRRRYLGMTGAAVAGLVVGGVLGYVAKPTVTAPPITSTETETVTVTGTMAPPPVTTAATPYYKQFSGQTVHAVTHDTADHRAVRALIAPEFQTLTGITIDSEMMGDIVLTQKIYTQLSTGATGPYDSGMVHMWLLEGYERPGWLTNLDPLVNAHPWEGILDLNDYVPLFASWCRTSDGKLSGLPFYGHAGCYMYRKDLAEKWGLTPPKTMDDLLAVTKNAHEMGRKEFGSSFYGISMRGIRGADNPHMYFGWPWAWGGRVLDADYNVVANSPECVQAFDYYGKILQSYGPSGSATFHWPEVQRGIMEGTVFSILEATDMPGSIEDPTASKTAGKIGYALLPNGPANTTPMFSYTTTWPVFAHSPVAEAALLWSEYATSGYSQKKTVIEGNFFRTGLTSKSAWTACAAAQPAKYWMAPVLLQAMEQTTNEYMPKIPEVMEIAGPHGDAVSSIVAGTPAKVALDKAAKEIYDILTKAGYNIQMKYPV
jgi:multiple sugar transport system substrate-binding protein/sorbitol/mannitol transport system substrate-binding protein